MTTKQIVEILNAAKTLMAKSVTLTEKDGELNINIVFTNFLEFSRAENVPIVYPSRQEKPIPVSPVVSWSLSSALYVYYG